MEKTPQEILKEYFGYNSFRPMQEEIISAVMNQKDAMVLMPTGGGKSLCYQIPAMAMDGVGIVVSPLIALMKDQVTALRQNGINAAFINSSQAPSEQRHVSEEAMRGNIKLLYVSPEKMVTRSFQEFLKSLDVNLFAIDEAHCISFWGHDFRPEYGQLSTLKERFGNVPIIALTATADKLTREDILKQLHLEQPEVFISSFDRPNLSIDVQPGTDRVKRIYRFLERRPQQSGIIYCLSRKSTESLAEKLRNRGFNAAHYHARLPIHERTRVQDDFIKDDIQIICATIAFGMGIDKSNVRFVLHYNLPKNIESYYQEIGRAGRDGVASSTVLFYSIADVIQQRRMLQEEESDIRALKISKLERLQQFAESNMCRRRILLNYFGEEAPKDCGNCDVCNNPRETFDGTVVAQKALSAITRMKEKAAMGTVVDVLRGVRSYNVASFKYDLIKTFGAGKEYKQQEWMQYLMQLVNLGFLEIAYNQYNALKMLPKSKEVLFNGLQVQLVRAIVETNATAKEKKAAKAKTTGSRTKKAIFNEAMFEHLRALRKQLADEQGVPPYIVFNDRTLNQMTEDLPLHKEAFLEISGVGQRKLADYGADFMKGIAEFLMSEEGKQYKNETRKITFAYYLNNFSPEDIAHARDISVNTILAHLGTLYLQNFPIEIHRFISQSAIDAITPTIKRFGYDGPLSEMRAALEDAYDYGQIRLAMAWLMKAENPYKEFV